jgi:hypothetical protein
MLLGESVVEAQVVKELRVSSTGMQSIPSAQRENMSGAIVNLQNTWHIITR